MDRSERGVNSLGMSLLKINSGVNFLEKGIVKVIIVLATIDNTTHLSALAELGNILSDSSKKEDLLKYTNKLQFMKLFELEEQK